MKPVYRLGVFIPIALALDAAGVSASAVLVVAALAIIPLAALMSEATEQLAARAGPGLGGLVNVTFGNAPELIIALIALGRGLQEVVKASIVGSVVGNALLVLGAAMLAGGWGRTRQRFDRTLAQTQSGMLLLTVVALNLPAVIVLAHHGRLPGVSVTRVRFGDGVDGASVAVAGILIATYVAGLVFSLLTHREVFNPAREEAAEEPWPLRRSLLTLLAAAAAVVVMSDVLVSSIEQASRQLGLSPFFIGAFVVAIAANASEHYVAVVAAVRDKMSLAVSIAVGSSAQIGLFVAPVLVLASYVVGPAPMAMIFNPYEIAALLTAGIVATVLVSDGETTWFEGVQLIALYTVIGVIFYVA